MIICRISCIINVPRILANSLLDSCVELFCRELVESLARRSQLIIGEKEVNIILQKLVLDVGVIFFGRFEFEFIDSVARKFECELREAIGFYVAPSDYIVRERSRHDLELDELFYGNSSVLDSYVLKHLDREPGAILPALAKCCVDQRLSFALYCRLRSQTCNKLFNCFVQNSEIIISQKNVDQQSLFLAALLYYRCGDSSVGFGDLQESVYSDFKQDEYKGLLISLFDERPIQADSASLLLTLFDENGIRLVGASLKRMLHLLWRKSEIARWSSKNISVKKLKIINDALDVTGVDELTRQSAPRYSLNSPPAERAFSVDNAGIVLLWPLFPDLFTKLGLWTSDRFVHEHGTVLASAWLDLLSWGNEVPDGSRLSLNNLLCGLPVETELFWQPVDDDKRNILFRWLEALPANLPGWERLDVEDIRSLFFRRPGLLFHSEIGGTCTLEVETHASDVLLRSWLWPISNVLLPWMKRPLNVIWEQR
nr:hypothetical protein HUO10_005035 [Paraburkholderia busanensis]